MFVIQTADRDIAPLLELTDIGLTTWIQSDGMFSTVEWTILWLNKSASCSFCTCERVRTRSRVHCISFLALYTGLRWKSERTLSETPQVFIYLRECGEFTNEHGLVRWAGAAVVCMHVINITHIARSGNGSVLLCKCWANVYLRDASNQNRTNITFRRSRPAGEESPDAHWPWMFYDFGLFAHSVNGQKPFRWRWRLCMKCVKDQ